MLFNRIIGHCSFISHTGYADHSRNFFRRLNDNIPVRIRNFTWIDKFDHLDSLDNQLTIYQEWPEAPWKYGSPYSKQEYDKILNIVLMETNHFYYYENYDEPVIGYNVWEITRQPDQFFKQWMRYLQLWVPTEWQRQCTIEQGCPENRVKVVPEGVDGNVFFPMDTGLEYNRFKFMIFGRWDYRKATTETIRAFLNTFKKWEPVDLVISVDNPFPADGMKSTEERLRHYKFTDDRIKILHFPSREKYVSYLRSGHCLISCARAEGWGLPLIEAIACGTPTICSNYGAQLEFAKDVSHMVNIKGHLPPKEVFMQKDVDLKGTYCEPDFEHLGHIMRNVYENYNECKIKALADSEIIRKKFTWENAVKIALSHIKNITEEEVKDHKKRIYKTPDESVKYSFHNGAMVDINGPKELEYNVKFIDNATNKMIHEQIIKTGTWVKPNIKYHVNWKIRIDVNDEVYSDHLFDPTGKRVIIVLDSTAIGDRICWMPYAEEFRKKYNCTVFLATGMNWLFKNAYPEINFINYGITIDNIYATYSIRMEDNSPDINKNNWHLVPLQQSASDYLGLEFKEIRPIIQVKKLKRPIKERYVCIAEHSTFRCKYWNHKTGWQTLVNYLNSVGYKVMVITKEKSFLKHVIHNNNKPLEESVNNLQHCEFFIGISSGLAWLAWGLGIKTVVISGCTLPFVEMQDCIRIINKDVCHGCFNDPEIDLEKPNWDFCPRGNNFICTTSITPEYVIEKIQPLIKEK
jgi:autotransporter strand-loop-strand O-heptosyltransferase